jgi:hypothetical protein
VMPGIEGQERPYQSQSDKKTAELDCTTQFWTCIEIKTLRTAVTKGRRISPQDTLKGHIFKALCPARCWGGGLLQHRPINHPSNSYQCFYPARFCSSACVSVRGFITLAGYRILSRISRDLREGSKRGGPNQESRGNRFSQHQHIANQLELLNGLHHRNSTSSQFSSDAEVHGRRRWLKLP